MNNETTFTDALGQTPVLGDIIFYGQTGRYSEFMIGKVVKLTPKGIRIKCLKGDRGSQTSKYKNEFQVNDGSHAVIITDVPAAERFKDAVSTL